MSPKSLRTNETRKYYDFISTVYGWSSSMGGRARQLALLELDLVPGLSVLNIGMGTGEDHALIQAAVSPGGVAFGIDISMKMLERARKKTRSPVLQADAIFLPFANSSVDRLFCGYTLDLVPECDLPAWIIGFRRVLKPEGRMVLVHLTEGVNWSSRTFVSIWNIAYSVSPFICGGCRPLNVEALLHAAGFTQVDQMTIVESGVPSAIVSCC